MLNISVKQIFNILWSNQIKWNQMRSNQMKSNQIKSNEMKSNQSINWQGLHTFKPDLCMISLFLIILIATSCLPRTLSRALNSNNNKNNKKKKKICKKENLIHCNSSVNWIPIFKLCKKTFKIFSILSKIFKINFQSNWMDHALKLGALSIRNPKRHIQSHNQSHHYYIISVRFHSSKPIV